MSASVNSSTWTTLLGAFAIVGVLALVSCGDDSSSKPLIIHHSMEGWQEGRPAFISLDAFTLQATYPVPVDESWRMHGSDSSLIHVGSGNLEVDWLQISTSGSKGLSYDISRTDGKAFPHGRYKFRVVIERGDERATFDGRFELYSAKKAMRILTDEGFYP